MNEPKGLRALMERIGWFAPLRGGWPSVPTTNALPEATEAYGNRIVTVRGPADTTYQCLRSGTGTWRWYIVAGSGGSSLTIASGAVTATSRFHGILTEGAAASDDLDTINGGVVGQQLVIIAANPSLTVVAKDGTGNLKLAGDMTLDNSEDTLTLLYNGSNWIELARSNNGA